MESEYKGSIIKMSNLEDSHNNSHGYTAVTFALVGNGFIAVLKLIGFFISGSSALFSEAVHSFADTLNQALLMVGIKKSTKLPDKEFSYGYGRERFVWALISACGVFFVGAGITIYHGINSLIHHEEIEIGPIVFIILAVSFLVESFTFLVALWELKRANRKMKLVEALKHGDPATAAILYEDGVAVLGVIIAFLSTILSKLTNNFLWDGIGSIIIGVLLGIVAVILINKNREFLIAKSVPESVKKKIIKILEADPSIEKVIDFKSAILDIGRFRVKCEVEFNGTGLLKEIYKDDFLKQEYELVKKDYGEFAKFCADYVDRVPRLIGNKIDEIEKKVQKQVPEIKHLDIEIN